MAKFTDKNSYIIIFSIIMVLIVGVLLAGVAQGLSGQISKNQRFEKQQNILYAMGINENEGEGDVTFIPTDKVESVFDKYIKEQLVIQGDSATKDPEAFLIDVNKEESLEMEDANYQRRMPLFIGENEGKTLYIVPIYGKGLWNSIWGYVSLDEDLIVHGVFFDHAGETPGLGANIKERYFMDPFKGEHIMDENTFAGIKVAKNNNDPSNLRKEDHKVDALAGSTITGDGVSGMIRKDLALYIPYLQKITKQQ